MHTLVLPGAVGGEAAALERLALAWQVGLWNRLSGAYRREVEGRLAPVVEHVVARAAPAPGERVLDIGTGTGAVAVRAAPLVGPSGRVVGVDISPAMLRLAQERAARAGLGNVALLEGRAEAIPARDGAFDVVLASLSLMYALDRGRAARECARVLRPGGRFVAAAWAGPEQCDIVLFQQTAGPFAAGRRSRAIGCGALADPSPFLDQLVEAGIDAKVEAETIGFGFDSFATAWEALADGTGGRGPSEGRDAARTAVLAAMWPHGDGPRHFTNVTRFIVGRRVA